MLCIMVGFSLVIWPQEAVSRTTPVDVESRDSVHWIIAYRECALASAGSCARSVKRGDRAACSAQKTVSYIIRVNIPARDHS